jgi:hypothetical protein
MGNRGGRCPSASRVPPLASVRPLPYACLVWALARLVPGVGLCSHYRQPVNDPGRLFTTSDSIKLC